MSDTAQLPPLHVFRFQVDFEQDSIGPNNERKQVLICNGAFSECSGLEATMEPKVIKEGGRNYGAIQRAGPVTFGTVVLKRGMTTNRQLWQWFATVAGGGYAYHLTATVTMFDVAGRRALAWRLNRALPIKFKAADLNASGNDIGIEELHLAHEGLTFIG